MTSVAEPVPVKVRTSSRPINSCDQIADRRYRSLHLNLMWTSFAHMDLGAEFIWGERVTATGLRNGATRITPGARYSY